MMDQKHTSSLALCVMVGFITLLVSSCKIDQSSLAWSNFQGNNRHTGYVDVNIDPSSLRVKWEREVVNPYSTSQIIADQNNYYFSEMQWIEAGKLDSGESIWQGSADNDFLDYGPPVLHKNEIYSLTNQHLIRFNKIDGASEKYRNEMLGTDFFTNFPQFDADLAFFQRPMNGSVQAFNTVSGEVVWEVPLQGRANTVLTIHNGKVITFDQEELGLLVLDSKTGNTISKIGVPACDFIWMTTAPIVDEVGSVYFVCKNTLYKFDLGLESLVWQQAVDNAWQMAIDKENLYLLTSTALQKRSLDTGEIIKQKKYIEDDAHQIGVGLVLTKNMVFVSGKNSPPRTNFTDGIEKSTLSLVWSYDKSGFLSMANDTLLINDEESITAVGFTLR